MTVTVVGSGAAAWDAIAELQGQGYAVRLVEDGVAGKRRADPEELPLDEHATILLERAARRREALDRIGVGIEPRDLSPASPSIDRSRCEVLSGRRVVAFVAGADRRVAHLRLERTDGSGAETLPVETLVLAADTLTTTRIFLESWRLLAGENARLTGLTRTRQVRFSFLTRDLIGRPIDAHAAGGPQIAIALRERNTEDDVHGAIATVQIEGLANDVAAMFLDVRTAFRIVRETRAALGSVSLQLPDRPRATCYVEMTPDGLDVRWEPPTGDRAQQGRAVTRARRALRLLDAWPLPGVETLPANTDDGYAGTLPMTDEERPFTTRADGSSRDFARLYILGDAGQRPRC